MKKVMSLLLVLMIVLSLSACGSNETATDNDTGNSTTQNQTDVTDTSSTEQSADTSSSTTDIIGSSDSTDIPNSTTTTKPNPPTHTHSYSSATCTAPAKCSCGATNGSALGHNYGNADCTNPKKCSRCGATNGSALGHNYSNGVCSRCSSKDPNYVKTYSLGEKWVVDGEWELTIDSVTKHYFCSTMDMYEEMNENCAQCVMITFSYKNIGYKGMFSDLYFDSYSLDVYDKNGEAAEVYENLGCSHSKRAKEVSSGKSCSGAQWTYALYTESDTITIEIEYYTSKQEIPELKKAVFVVPVS